MNIVQELVSRKIADNDFHAAGMLNVLECGRLKTDEERLARCTLYKAWCEYLTIDGKISKVNKLFARAHAINGDPAPAPMFEKESETK